MKKLTVRKVVPYVAFVVLLVVIAGYTIYQFQDYWSGPTITITSHSPDYVPTDPVLELAGTAERISFLYLNDRQIFTNQSGEFSETLLLNPGYNIIAIEATDRFDRSVTKRFDLYYQPTATTTN